MLTKKTRSNVLEYAQNIIIMVDRYENNNSYVGLYDNEGECYKDITTNIFPLFGLYGYVLANDKEIISFLDEQGLAVSTGSTIKHNMNTYILYHFNIDNSFTEEDPC